MKSQAFVMPFAPSLHASFEGKPWIIMIRRTDGKSHGQFFDYHDKEFTQKDIKKFIPNFDSLKWRKVEIDDPLLDTCEMVAVDKDFKINVIRVDPKFTAEEMIEDFSAYLREK